MFNNIITFKIHATERGIKNLAEILGEDPAQKLIQRFLKIGRIAGEALTKAMVISNKVLAMYNVKLDLEITTTQTSLEYTVRGSKVYNFPKAEFIAMEAESSEK